MPESSQSDTISALERARARLYKPTGTFHEERSLSQSEERAMPHAWEADPLKRVAAEFSTEAGVRAQKHVRTASMFFFGAFLFFVVSLGVTLYIFFVGGNSVSVDKIAIALQGPTSITGGDPVTLSVVITNTNAVPIHDATIEIDFPSTAKHPDDTGATYPRYTENLGTLASGASITRSVQVRLFGAAGQSVQLPVSLSYSAQGSNAVFVKKSAYAVLVSSTPLAVSVSAGTEAVSGQPITISLIASSNASVPIENVVLAATFPFGFSLQTSSIPLTSSGFLLGTLAPGATEKITFTGILTGDQNDQRVFHFTIGTAASAQNQTLAVSYMTQDVSVGITAPFISTSVALNGDTSTHAVLAPGTLQNITVGYTNTLTTSITNATIKVTLAGTGLDFGSIQTSKGFYDSTNHTVVFSRDTDPSLAALAPGASGIGTLSFRTPEASLLSASPTVTLITSVSGTRVGQTNVPEQITASATQVAKVMTAVAVTGTSQRTSSLIPVTGPVPPRAGQATTYAIQWNVRTAGSAIAGGVMKTILPSYVTYTGVTTDAAAFSYDSGSRTVTWNVGDLAPSIRAGGSFQVSLTPSTSQRGTVPSLTGTASFSGYDRFAGMQVTGSVEPVTTETKTDPGYVVTNAVVQ